MCLFVGGFICFGSWIQFFCGLFVRAYSDESENKMIQIVPRSLKLGDPAAPPSSESISVINGLDMFVNFDQ